MLSNSSYAKPDRFADMIAAHYVPALSSALMQAKAIEDTEPLVAARVRATMETMGRSKAW